MNNPGSHVKLLGFDGNNEAEYCSIARFMIEDLGRWALFKRRELNCHYPSLYHHRRMLQEYRDCVGRGAFG